jgi:hypothetical protein
MGPKQGSAHRLSEQKRKARQESGVLPSGAQARPNRPGRGFWINVRGRLR